MPDNTQTRSHSKAPGGVHLWLVLWKATRTVETIARRNVEGFGICLSDFAVLEALLHKGPLPVQALGAKVLLTSGSMTAAVDRLEDRGLVERRRDPGDRRTRIVRLTARGRRIIRGMFARHEQAMEQAVAVLSATERSALVELLRKLGRGVEAQLSESNRNGIGGALSVRESKRRRK
jgi:MarR family transcriptional regulator, 2-MHQ and catechol-resistance regulon repressor